MEHGCWVLGGEFEDSVFEDRPERLSRPLAPYGAKRCEPQWFYEETESSDDADILTLKKFRGDLAYRRQEYEKALQEYSTISEKLSPTNFAMKRDVQEGQARCLAHLGRHVEALEIATNLEKKATNTDHLTTVFYLQFAICSSLQNLEKTILCLQKLISLHPLNPCIWYKLAEAYLNLGPALSASNAYLNLGPAPSTSSAYLNLGPAPSASNAYLNLGPAPSASNAYLNLGPAPSASSASSWEHKRFTSNGKAIKSSCLLCLPETLPKSLVFSMEASSSNHQKAEKVADTHTCLSEARETVWIETQMKACSALIRTRLLLQLTQPQQTSFVLEKNLRTQQEIADEMKGFGFTEDALLLIEEVMGEDIVPEKIKDEAHSEVKCIGPAALTALVVASSKEFEDKWFRKIKERFCL